MKNNIVEIKDLKCPQEELACALKDVFALSGVGSKIKNYTTTALAIADVKLLSGTFYTVTTGAVKQVYIK